MEPESDDALLNGNDADRRVADRRDDDRRDADRRDVWSTSSTTFVNVDKVAMPKKVVLSRKPTTTTMTTTTTLRARFRWRLQANITSGLRETSRFKICIFIDHRQSKSSTDKQRQRLATSDTIRSCSKRPHRRKSIQS